ncbi:MAG: hypothetical protein HY321_16155 [Armatimonadetes bacterium]|nr:hypothetical protein [Armatimonadota bacterium]
MMRRTLTLRVVVRFFCCTALALSRGAAAQAGGPAAPDTQAPVISDVYPAADATVSHPQPVIFARLNDEGGSGVNPASVRLLVGGRDVTQWTIRGSSFLIYSPDYRMDNGPVVVRTKVADHAGNTARIEWQFTVRAPAEADRNPSVARIKSVLQEVASLMHLGEVAVTLKISDRLSQRYSVSGNPDSWHVESATGAAVTVTGEVWSAEISWPGAEALTFEWGRTHSPLMFSQGTGHIGANVGITMLGITEREMRTWVLAFLDRAECSEGDLAVLAETASDEVLRTAATAKVWSRPLLAHLAVAGRHMEVRSEALWHLRDSFRYGRSAAAVGRRLLVNAVAVDRLSGENALADTAVNHGDGGMRAAAVVRLTNQALLARIAVEDADPYVRQTAVYLIRDGNLLAKVAVEDRAPDVRSTAVIHLTDHVALASIAVSDRDKGVRAAAARRFRALPKDASRAPVGGPRFARAATVDKDPDVRYVAVCNLTDQELLAKVALGDKDERIRSAALERLTNQALLSKVAIRGKHYNERKAAVEKMTDQDLLAEIALSHKDAGVREAAAKQLGYMGVRIPGVRLLPVPDLTLEPGGH